MKASYTWLRSLLPALEASPQEVADRLTGAGLEMEELIEFGAVTPNVFVSEVKKVEPHPSRERLRLVTVDRGGSEQTVVCGAPNVPDPGGRVVLAPLGTTLPAIGLTIEPRPIGGVESQGMLCSDVELGLVSGAGKGDGILVLPESLGDIAVGTPLSEAIEGVHDWVFDIGVTPNRPDALGHVGLARELAALFEIPFETPKAPPPARTVEGDVTQRASVVVDDPERCPIYAASVVDGVKVGASPLWLQYRLEALGVRSISNVVDVTNYLLLLFGHPTHAFDYAKVPDGKIVVRRAKSGEKMETIDHVERELTDDDLLITDGHRPIAMAGVMGGADSEIGDDSTSVLFEVAYFAPRGIRRAARRHGLHSEASHRFERGVDPEQVEQVTAHGVSLLCEICGGSAVPGAIVAGPGAPAHAQVELRKEKMDAVLGMDIPIERAQAILERLGFGCRQDGARLSVDVPSHRPDCAREEDLIEEVMRVNGIDHVPFTHRALTLHAGRSELSLRDRARQVAAAIGLDEALPYSFVSPKDLTAIGAPEPTVVMKNPLSEDRSVMRTSLLTGLLDALRHAQRRGVADIRVFCTGPAFLPRTEKVEGEDGWLPHERLELAAVLAGSRRAGVEVTPLDVYDAKGIAVELVERLSGREAIVSLLEDRTAIPYLHPRGAGEVTVDGTVVGHLGPLHPDVADALSLTGEAFVVVVDLDAIGTMGRATPRYRPIPVLPAATRDLALVVEESVPAARVATVMREAGGDHCEAVELFDLYSGKGVPDGHRSLAYHLVFRHPLAATDPDNASTLTDKEVDGLTKKVVQAVKKELGATVRGG